MKAVQIRVASLPDGIPQASNFRTEATELAAPAAGELLVETLFLSLDPYMRGKLSGRHMSGALHPGDLMAGETVSRVLDSKATGFAAGDLVTAHSGWTSHAIIPASMATKVDTRGLSPSLALGVLGMPGLTAYAGITRLSDVQKGDVYVVSAASGPVGSAVGQLARLRGAKVVGIAGGAEKCAWVTGAAGFAACVDYKAGDLRALLDAACPIEASRGKGTGGIDCYFDNVGGDMLQAVMERLALGARVVLCGLMAQYNSAVPLPGPNPGLTIKARATVRGLVVYDHDDLKPAMIDEISGHIKAGRFAVKEDVTTGLENAPAVFERLMHGGNFGKTLIHVAA
jgi:NADPH-dependent curcumin reductase